MTIEDGCRKIRTSMTLDRILVERIDEERGLVPRSAFVNHLIERTLSEKVS